MNKNDLRVKKTRKALYNALLKLMEDKQFEDIRVSDICSNALINRSTFYAHFDDKYDLLASCINDLKSSLTNKLKKGRNISSTKEYYMELIKAFLDYIEENKDAYLAIAKHNSNNIVTDIICDVIDADIAKRVKDYDNNNNNNNTIPTNILAKFYSGAVVTVAIYWMYHINSYTKEEMIDYLTILLPDEVEKTRN